MNKILHLSAGSSCLPNKDNISISEVDLSKIAEEQSLASIYNLLSDELDSCNSLIINCDIGLPEQELFEIGVYIRLKRGTNWDIPIFIYSEGGIRSLFALVKYDQIGISRTNRFDLINQSEFEKDEITGSTLIDLKIASMYQQELNWEDFVRKIEVKNSKDKHTIANEWAIYRWAQTIGATDISIENLNYEISSSLYFHYLKAIYPISIPNHLPDKKLKIAVDGIKPKIIYIDDEADRGWNGIFWEIFKKNGIEDFIVVGYEEMKSLSKNEIIDLAVSEVIDLDADIVILDFRIHASDFNTNAANTTGLEILKKIKKINPGIQVIMFTATNKIWNLQALLESGVDGFVIKESPENSIDQNFTKQSIQSFIKEVNKANNRRFLKSIFIMLNQVLTNIINCYSIEDTSFSNFLNLIEKQVRLIISSSKKIDLNDESTLDIVFLNCFNFLESFKNDYFVNYNTRDYTYTLGIDEVDMNRYVYNKVNFNIENLGRFTPNNSYDKPSFFCSLTGVIIDLFELCNLDNNLIIKVAQITEQRNNFIHGNKQHFTQTELIMIIEIMVKVSGKLKE